MKTFFIKFFYLFLIGFILLSCKDNSKGGNSAKANNPMVSNSSKDSIPNEPIDSTTDAIAKFVAGIETPSLAHLQSKDWYKRHVKLVEEVWQQNQKERLTPISQWIEKNGITNSSDTGVVFYPFSGPDFLYVSTFFPHNKTYIMAGLEKPGFLPTLSSIPEPMLATYLDSIRNSLRCINKFGYFATLQMKDDFNMRNLNGLVHILLYYLARTNHDIIKYSVIEVDKFGVAQEIPVAKATDKKAVYGVKLIFRNNVTKMRKTLYYLPINIENDNMKDKYEYLNFFSRFGKKITYLKSASYLLHRPEFTMIRNLITNQSTKILQDDTGVPFTVLSSLFNIKLYGNYIAPIKLFEVRYQPDLRKAVQKEKPELLPFTIGYNVSNNEFLLILAQKEEVKSNEATNSKVSYRVQIKSSSQKLNADDPAFKGLQNIDFYMEEGVYKYTVGNESSEAACENLKKTAIEKGFADAFVIAIYDKKRISLDEAKKIK
jgi:hypothetical protein